MVAQGGIDAALGDAARFTVYRVRFQVVNHGDQDAIVTPALEVGGPADWTALPLVDPDAGKPFYGASDAGKVFEPRREAIAVSELRLRDDLDPLAGPVEGQSSAGRPVGAITLPAHSYTEIEFAVRATVDARWGERYAFRLLDGADVIAGAPPAELVMGGKPAVDLSPGQRKGKPTTDPVPRYRLDPSIGLTDMSIAQAPVAASAAQFNLRGPVAAPTRPRPALDLAHVQGGLASDSCAGCHAAHTAQGPMLLQQPDPQSGTCFTCHDGTGALSDVRSDWDDPALPANDPATGSYYSHPATTTGGHVSGVEDEFAGVLNRHAVCADCHQPHLADGTKAIQSTGRLVRFGRHPGPGRGGDERRGGLGSHLRVEAGRHVRVRALPQVPLRLHDAAGTGRGPPQPVGIGQGHRAQPG